MSDHACGFSRTHFTRHLASNRWNRCVKSAFLNDVIGKVNISGVQDRCNDIWDEFTSLCTDEIKVRAWWFAYNLPLSHAIFPQSGVASKSV